MLNARTETGIVFYDGECALCNRWVRFLVKRDRGRTLKFAPLQGETATQRHDLPKNISTVVFVRQPDTPHEEIFLRSEAALRLLDHVGSAWRIVSWLRVVPRSWRDAVYNAIACRRYRWFGKSDSCERPPAEWRAQFLP